MVISISAGVPAVTVAGRLARATVKVSSVVSASLVVATVVVPVVLPAAMVIVSGVA